VIGRELVSRSVSEAITEARCWTTPKTISPIVRDDRDRAIWILKTLIENGLIELHADEISLRAPKLSRIGGFSPSHDELTGADFAHAIEIHAIPECMRSFLEKRSVRSMTCSTPYEYSSASSHFSDSVIADWTSESGNSCASRSASWHRAVRVFEFMEEPHAGLALRFSEDSSSYNAKTRRSVETGPSATPRNEDRGSGELRRVAPS